MGWEDGVGGWGGRMGSGMGYIFQRVFSSNPTPSRLAQDLREGLQAFIAGETVDYTWETDGKKERLETTKRASLKELPKHLIIHLKRFEYDFDTDQQVKLNDRYEFPRSLDLYVLAFPLRLCYARLCYVRCAPKTIWLGRSRQVFGRACVYVHGKRMSCVCEPDVTTSVCLLCLVCGLRFGRYEFSDVGRPDKVDPALKKPKKKAAEGAAEGAAMGGVGESKEEVEAEEPEAAVETKGHPRE